MTFSTTFITVATFGDFFSVVIFIFAFSKPGNAVSRRPLGDLRRVIDYVGYSCSRRQNLVVSYVLYSVDSIAREYF